MIETIFSNSGKVLGTIFLLSCSAYLSIDVAIAGLPIPFSGQSLMLFILAALLRPQFFLISILGYLILGCLGLPIFAQGSAGFDKLFGASGGFLYGFIFSGWYISKQFDHQKTKIIWSSIKHMLVATAILFFFGLTHLMLKFGWGKALEYGLFPFWHAAIIKAIVAGIVVILVQSLKPRVAQMFS